MTTISLLYGDITWTAGTYLGRPANTFALTDNAVNQDIIDHGTVLGFFKMNNAWQSMPFSWENSDGTSREYILHTYSLNTITLYAYRTIGVLNPATISEFRFILITDNTVTGTKGTISDKDILSSLKEEGVDVNDYWQVIGYFDLEY